MQVGAGGVHDGHMVYCISGSFIMDENIWKLVVHPYIYIYPHTSATIYPLMHMYVDSLLAPYNYPTYVYGHTVVASNMSKYI